MGSAEVFSGPLDVDASPVEIPVPDVDASPVDASLSWNSWPMSDAISSATEQLVPSSLPEIASPSCGPPSAGEEPVDGEAAEAEGELAVAAMLQRMVVDGLLVPVDGEAAQAAELGRGRAAEEDNSSDDWGCWTAGGLRGGAARDEDNSSDDWGCWTAGGLRGGAG